MRSPSARPEMRGGGDLRALSFPRRRESIIITLVLLSQWQSLRIPAFAGNDGVDMIAAEWWWAVAGSILGALIGSFIATLVLRWPEGRSVLTGRSQCDGCGRTLSPAELVPLASYVVLKGRCQACRAAIDLQHPAIELLAALIGAVSLGLLPGVAGLGGVLFGWMLLALAFLDARHFWLPDAITVPLLMLGVATSALMPFPSLTDRLIGAGIGYGVLVLIGALYALVRKRQGLGGGDPKLLAAIGAWVGWQALPYVLLVASGVGLGWAVVAILRGRRVSGQDRLPFGTLLAIAGWPIWLILTLAHGV